MGYKGGEKLREPWWRQAAANKQMRVILEEILAAARERREQEYGRRGKEGRFYGEGTYSNG